jgi:hypothetical protein
VLGGEPVSLPKERRYPPRSPSPSGQDVQDSRPARSLSFSQRGQRCRRDRPPLKLLCATAALIQVRRAKQLSSAYKEGSPSLDPRMDAA